MEKSVSSKNSKKKTSSINADSDIREHISNPEAVYHVSAAGAARKTTAGYHASAAQSAAKDLTDYVNHVANALLSAATGREAASLAQTVVKGDRCDPYRQVPQQNKE